MEICGHGARIDLPYTYFLAPEKDIKISMCVKECPKTTGRSICLYKDNAYRNGTTELPHFCNSTLESSKYGTFCFPK